MCTKTNYKKSIQHVQMAPVPVMRPPEILLQRARYIRSSTETPRIMVAVWPVAANRTPQCGPASAGGPKGLTCSFGRPRVAAAATARAFRYSHRTGSSCKRAPHVCGGPYSRAHGIHPYLTIFMMVSHHNNHNAPERRGGTHACTRARAYTHTRA